MRSLLFRNEEKPMVAVSSVATPSPAVNTTVTESVIAEKKLEQEAAQIQTTRGQKVLTPKQKLSRRYRAAFWVLGISAAIGIRWYGANLEPTYPRGEGVYPAITAPKWREMKHANAATFYMAAVDEYHVDIPPSVKTAPNGVPEASLPVLKKLVAQAQPSFSLLRQGMQYSFVPDEQTNYYAFAFKGNGLDRPVTNFIAVREMARMLIAEAHVRAAEGDKVGALSSSLDAMRWGIDEGQGHTLIQGMIGTLAEGLGSEEAIHHVEGLSSTEARAAITRLEEMRVHRRTFAETMTAERDTGYEVIKSLFRESSIGSMVPPTVNTAMGNAGSHLMYDGVVMYYTKQGLVDAYAAQMDQVIARGKIPYQQAKARGEVPPSLNPLVQMLVPNAERAQGQMVRIEARSNVLLAQLAVQAYRADNQGAAPASLSELATGKSPYLKQMPLDPFSMSGNETLRYSAEEGIVYSVGENGRDEGGYGDDNLK